MFRHAKKTLIVAALLLTVSTEGLVSQAAMFRHRQYYSSWIYDGGHSCYYRNYYYLPQVIDVEYKVHVVYYYYVTYPNYYYYYNPVTQLYWGRSPIKDGEKLYSVLDPKDRRKDLKDIPESAFPKPSEPPAIPESKDNEKIAMEMPPKDLPAIPKDKK